MNKTTEALSELREFVAQQAAEDALLPPPERRHQAALVKDVLNQEVSSSRLVQELLGSYSSQIRLQR